MSLPQRDPGTCEPEDGIRFHTSLFDSYPDSDTMDAMAEDWEDENNQSLMDWIADLRKAADARHIHRVDGCLKRSLQPGLSTAANLALYRLDLWLHSQDLDRIDHLEADHLPERLCKGALSPEAMAHYHEPVQTAALQAEVVSDLGAVDGGAEY